MQVGCRPASGLRLWDVKFGGERIVYELALQEALVSLSGATPSQARSQEGTKELDEPRPLGRVSLLARVSWS